MQDTLTTPWCFANGREVTDLSLFEVAFSAAAVASAPVWLPAVGTTIATALVVYGCYELAVYTGNLLDDPIEGVEDKPVDVQGQGKRPPYCGEKLGDDPTVCPGEGFQWKGRGKPETGKGSWVKDLDLPTEESLHPDLWHLPPKPPHWDYVGPNYPGGIELNLDGTWTYKGV